MSKKKVLWLDLDKVNRRVISGILKAKTGCEFITPESLTEAKRCIIEECDELTAVVIRDSYPPETSEEASKFQKIEVEFASDCDQSFRYRYSWGVRLYSQIKDKLKEAGVPVIMTQLGFPGEKETMINVGIKPENIFRADYDVCLRGRLRQRLEEVLSRSRERT